MSGETRLLLVDYDDPEQGRILVELLDEYARHPMGGGHPLVNVHDLMVSAPFRGEGLAGRILAKVEEIARQRGCCKVTLEVLEGNEAAQRAYRRAGFAPYELDPAQGRALFWEKKL